MTKNTVKIGPVSYNFKTGKVNFDRRTIKGEPAWKHVAYIAAGAAATAAVAFAIRNK